MRVLYIIAIFFAFLFIIIMIAGTVGTNDERDRYYRYQMEDDEYSYYDSTPQYVETTYISVGISIPYFLFMLTLCILGLVCVKTATNKVFGIIGLSLTGLMLIWGLLVLSNPRNMSFDEVGGGWILYGIFTLVLAIIGTVQAFRYHGSKQVHFMPQPGWPPQQPWNAGQPPYGQPGYPPQQPYGQPGYPPQQQPPYPQQTGYPPQQGQPGYPPPPPPGQAPWTR